MSTRHVIGGNTYPYKNWAPYCLRCSSPFRMRAITEESWRCDQCGARHEGPPSWLREPDAQAPPVA